MVWRNPNTGNLCVMNPAYDPAYWNGVKEQRRIIKQALANQSLVIKSDNDGWFSAWYNNRFISGWLKYRPEKAREILFVIANMLRSMQ